MLQNNKLYIQNLQKKSLSFSCSDRSKPRLVIAGHRGAWKVLFWGRLILTCCLIFFSSAIFAMDGEIEGQWINGYKNRTRLFAGVVKEKISDKIYTFIEIEMSKGWKTYWRNPGTAGGIPPEFDFGKSQNISEVEVLYPVPELISDTAGDTIGYKEHVIFPLAIKPNIKEKPLEIAVTANYGICEKLCVPVEVNLSLTIPPNFSNPASEEALAALAAVPRPKNALLSGDPRDLDIRQMLSEFPQRIILSARFPGSAERAKIFLDVEGGKYIPFPVQIKVEDEIITYELDLSDSQVLEALRRSKVRVTMKGQNGQSEDSFIIN